MPFCTVFVTIENFSFSEDESVWVSYFYIAHIIWAISYGSYHLFHLIRNMKPKFIGTISVSILFAWIKIFISFCRIGKAICCWGKNCFKTYGVWKFCRSSWEFTKWRIEDFTWRVTFKIGEIRNKSSRIFKTNMGLWPTIWWFLSKQPRHLV